MQGCASFKVVFGGRLVVVPVHAQSVLLLLLLLPATGHKRELLHLLSAKDETLLNGWDTLLFLDTLLYARDLEGESVVSQEVKYILPILVLLLLVGS